MNYSRRIGFAVIILLMLPVLVLGCSGTGGSEGNPLVPSDGWPKRQVMEFAPTQTIFGTPSNVASEVDLASVVWGQVSVATGCGDVVKWEDGTLEGTSWVAAIGIKQLDLPGIPSIPVVRFLRNDGTTMSPEFPVFPNPPVLGQDCHFPRIDCTYLDNGKVQVTVAFRYGTDMSNWDLQLHHLVFKYTLADGWELQGSLPITSPAMINPVTAQTHPDIAYDQASGDVYCAWTEIISGIVIDVVYQRFSGDPPSIVTVVPLSLSLPVMVSGWFVSLDVGKVMLPWGAVPERVVAFAYTAQQPNGFLGLHPVVGWWNIDAGPDDSDHKPNHVLIQYLYWPVPDHPYHAGMIRVDIPCDNAPGHGGAVVFVQDTEIGWGYQVFGISSLYPWEYAWISGPGCGPFNRATLPSIAIHDTGLTAAVTYFGMDGDGLWDVWATHWKIDGSKWAGATAVDTTASGEFELDIDTLINYDFGTGSSLAFSGANTYWAAWSDRNLETFPTRVFGSMGIAND